MNLGEKNSLLISCSDWEIDSAEKYILVDKPEEKEAK